jgi:hypothetical protein
MSVHLFGFRALRMCTYSGLHNYNRGVGLLSGGGFLESDRSLRWVEPSQVVSSLLSRASSRGWIWIVRRAWTGGVIITTSNRKFCIMYPKHSTPSFPQAGSLHEDVNLAVSFTLHVLGHQYCLCASCTYNMSMCVDMQCIATSLHTYTHNLCTQFGSRHIWSTAWQGCRMLELKVEAD